MSSLDACLLCRRNAEAGSVQGGILYEDAYITATHIPTFDEPTAYRGWIMVAPKRHVYGLGDLDDTEAAQIGITNNRIAAALRHTLGAEHVYSFVFGHTAPHLHFHLLPRYPGTPPDYWGWEVRAWPDAPKVSPSEMSTLVAELAETINLS